MKFTVQYPVKKILREKYKTFIPYLKILAHNKDYIYFILVVLTIFTFSKKMLTILLGVKLPHSTVHDFLTITPKFSGRLALGW